MGIAMYQSSSVTGDQGLRSIGVLIVDDQADVLTTLSGGLTDLSIPVSRCDDPIQALHTVMNDPSIGVVVMDIHMPVLNGIDLITSMRECCRDRPWMQYIVMTGNASLETATASLKLGVSDFLQKPFNATKFREVVLRAIVRARHSRAQTHGAEAANNRLDAGRETDLATECGGAGSGLPASQRDGITDPALARSLLNLRRARFKSLPGELADDVAVTILLELFDAATSGEEVAYSSICAIDGVSPSTAQRRVQEMLDDNFLIKVVNGKEKRRYSITLSEKGMSITTNYLNAANRYITRRL
jgi:FixJ family two-component response regulator